MTEYEQPETVEVDETFDYVPQEPMPFNEYRVQQATIGDLLCIPLTQDPPAGWIKCEPIEVTKDEYPEFFEALVLSGESITLPDALNTDLQQFIIKMRDIRASGSE